MSNEPVQTRDNPLGRYHDPRDPTMVSGTNQRVYSSRDIKLSGILRGAFETDFGVAHSLGTGQAFEGSVKIDVFMDPDTGSVLRHTLYMKVPIGKGTHNYDTYDYVPLTKAQAIRLDIYQETYDLFANLSAGKISSLIQTIQANSGTVDVDLLNEVSTHITLLENITGQLPHSYELLRSAYNEAVANIKSAENTLLVSGDASAALVPLITEMTIKANTLVHNASDEWLNSDDLVHINVDIGRKTGVEGESQGSPISEVEGFFDSDASIDNQLNNWEEGRRSGVSDQLESLSNQDKDPKWDNVSIHGDGPEQTTSLIDYDQAYNQSIYQGVTAGYGLYKSIETGDALSIAQNTLSLVQNVDKFIDTATGDVGSFLSQDMGGVLKGVGAGSIAYRMAA